MARPTDQQPSSPDFESEVRANILAQPLSPAHDLGTIADLDLPHDFLTRLADRVLRASFYERFRSVMDDGSPSAPTPAAPAPAPSTRGQTPTIHLDRLTLSAQDAATWSALLESPPTLASFRSPLTDNPAAAQQHLTGDVSSTHTLRVAQRTARKHLARDGFLPALAHTIAALGPARLLPPHTDALILLADAGFPIDLVAFIQPASVPESASPNEIITSLASRLIAGEPLDKLIKSLRKPRFAPRPSLPHFRPTSDSGHDAISLLRAHAARPVYFSAPGDGSNLDLLRATLAALSTTPALIHTADQHADELQSALSIAARPAATSLLTQPLRLSQWAGDNAKPGTLANSPAQLVPRFASRGEYHAKFIPGDDLALHAAAPHIRTARSPLLFQGGNLFLVDDLPRKQRILLIGEAEIQRNRALGLSAEQALAFLKLEFAADDTEILPAASYHLDQVLTIRSTSARTIAFVANPIVAATTILECALAAFASSNRWPAAIVQEQLAALHASRLLDALALIWRALAPERAPDHTWPLSLARTLSNGPADSGVGNFHRFLLALDHLAAEAAPASAFPDPNLSSLLRSFHRRAADRAKVRTLLSRRGWSIVPIPALPEESRGINPLNGLHSPQTYLMPAFGGLFAPLDDLSANAFQAILGPDVLVTPIPTAESQCREGALHCSVALFGR